MTREPARALPLLASTTKADVPALFWTGAPVVRWVWTGLQLGVRGDGVGESEPVARLAHPRRGLAVDHEQRGGVAVQLLARGEQHRPVDGRGPPQGGDESGVLRDSRTDERQ